MKAISMLTPEEISKLVFLFVGSVVEQKVFESIKMLGEKHPDDVKYIERLTRDEIKSLMTQCSAVNCSSTDDPMSTVVAEAAMYAKLGIVSEHTSMAGLITDGKDGFIYHNDNPRELCEVIRNVIKNPDELVRMHSACRVFYENNFTGQFFANKLGEYNGELIDNTIS